MLQGGATREEGVLEVVVEQTADGGHVDVGKAREAAGEVGGVVVRPEETPKLTVEDVLGLSPARDTHSHHQDLFCHNQTGSSSDPFTSWLLFL